MKYIFVVLLLFSSVNCKNKKIEQKKREVEMKNNMNQEKIYYAIDVKVQNNFELYVNDIKAAYYYGGGTSELVDLNPWVLKNGIHKIRIRFLPRVATPLLSQKDMDLNSIRLIRYKRDKIEKGYDLTVLEELSLPKIEKPTPFYDKEWEIEIKDLPYELEGWSNGQDLSKWDKEILQKKVVLYYKKLHDILNSGDAKTWMELTSVRSFEANFTNYVNSERIREEFEENLREINEIKGKLIPLENFEMKIYGKNNQLVCLERIATAEFIEYDEDGRGWSPLIVNSEEELSLYSVKLYLPKDSNEFVIIRK